MIVLGIDPGLHGAAALVDSAAPNKVEVLDFPIIGHSTKQVIDEVAIVRFIARPIPPDHSYIEYVNANPHWGVASVFRFGMTFGTLRTCVALCGVPYTLVTSPVWKKFFALKGAEKDQSIARAMQIFPMSRNLFSRKKDHQRAEAALIAMYGLRNLSSNFGPA